LKGNDHGARRQQRIYLVGSESEGKNQRKMKLLM